MLHPAVLWGIGGVVWLLVHALQRLVPIAMQITEIELGPVRGSVCVLWLFFMAYTEGYRGFQTSFSPRVVSRALTLPGSSFVFQCLAPLYCMSFFHATRRRLIVAWVLSTSIILFIALFRLLPFEWRVILDVGVVVGLGWGVLSLVGHAIKVGAGRVSPCDPELP
jgi:hypothetical protein